MSVILRAPNLQAFLTARELLTLVSKELSVPASEARKEDQGRSRACRPVRVHRYQNLQIQQGNGAALEHRSGDDRISRFLVMDEPMIGLDPAGSAHFREVFRNFAKERGGTIFLSSHIMQEVESLCTSALMIHKGKLLFSGSTGDIINRVLGIQFSRFGGRTGRRQSYQALLQISGVEGVSKKEANGARVTLELKIDSGREVRPSVADAVIKSGARLYSLGYSENLLERTYIEALRQGTPEAD